MPHIVLAVRKKSGSMIICNKSKEQNLIHYKSYIVLKINDMFLLN